MNKEADVYGAVKGSCYDSDTKRATTKKFPSEWRLFSLGKSVGSSRVRLNPGCCRTNEPYHTATNPRSCPDDLLPVFLLVSTHLHPRGIVDLVGLLCGADQAHKFLLQLTHQSLRNKVGGGEHRKALG